MKKSHSLMLSVLVVFGFVACGQEKKQDAAASAAEMKPATGEVATATQEAAKAADEGAKAADDGAKLADQAAKTAEETAKVADEAAKLADAHDPGAPGHVPCGAHGAGTPTADGPKYPSVFKTMPAFGTKISCPIKGETFEFSASRPTHEYNGKVYVFGCGGCKALFLKDPEAALKKYNFVEAP